MIAVGRSNLFRVTSALAILAAAASLASANDQRILLGRDQEYANALRRAGFRDLADDVYAALERGAKSGAVKVDPLVTAANKLEMLEEDARRELDPIKRAQLLVGVVEEMEKFVADHPGSGVADEIQSILPEKYMTIGEIITGALEKDPTSEAIAELRKKGQAMFDRAIEALNKRVDEVKKDRDDKRAANPEAEPDPELEERLMLGIYGLIRTNYFSSKLYDVGAFNKNARLDMALKLLFDFQLDYSDQLVCFEGFMYQGLCYAEKGENDDALSAFDSAIDVRDLFEKNNAGVFPVPDEVGDVISVAVLQKQLLLAKLGKHAEVVEASRDFYSSIPSPAKSMKGLAVLVQEAEACKALDDAKGLETAARKLIDADPRGAAGARGRELLGQAGPSALNVGDTYRLAESNFNRGDLDGAIGQCQQVFILARGTPTEADLGSQAALMLGGAYAQKQEWYEAVASWEAALDRYGKGKYAADCMWSAITGYLNLLKAEQKPYFKNKARGRMTELTSRFPNSPYATRAAVFEGGLLEAEGEYERAAANYEKVPNGSQAYEESLYRAANAWSMLARKHFQAGKNDDGKSAAKKAEDAFKNAKPALEAAIDKTLDVAVQDRLRSYLFSTRIGLANLYAMDGVKRPADALTLLEGADREFAADPIRLGAVRATKLTALQALNKIDEACALLDTMLRENPAAEGLGGTAAKLAQAMDKRAADLKAKDPNASDVELFYRRAASYYFLSIKGQIEGTEAVRGANLDQISARLYALGAELSRMPSGSDSLVDWSGKAVDELLFEQAVRALEAALRNSPSYRTAILHARCLGFLGQWEESANAYADLFDRERVADLGAKQINQAAMVAKAELLPAFVEWGFAEREASGGGKDFARMSRSSTIFETLAGGSTKEGKFWWQAKYYLLLNMYDRGDYENADIGVRSLERTNPDFDEDKYGLKAKFIKLRDELSKKVFK